MQRTREPTHVVTLICDPSAPALDGALLARTRAALPEAEDAHWLADGISADVPFRPALPGDSKALAEDLRRTLVGAKIDVAVQPVAHRRKKLLVADMDSTMIGQECIDELADFAGLRAEVAAITERAMRGEVAFAPALRERVALLRGLPQSIIDRVIAERISLTPGARTLAATMRCHGAYTCLVSGGFTAFTEPVRKKIGFDESRGNLIAIDSGVLTGRVREPVLGREAKRAALIELRERLGLEHAETLAVGDGANDLDMLAEAGLGVAYRAKPKVAEAAAVRIDHGDLTALLYLQGYRREEFGEG